MDDNLEMSIFDSDDVELNLDNNLPEDFFVDNEIPDEQDKPNEGDNKPADDAGDNENKLIDGEDQEDVDKKDAQDDEGGDDDNDSPNLYSSFATVLNEQGLLPSMSSDKEIKSIEDLTEVFKSELNNQAKEYIVNKIGEDGFNALEKGITLSEYQSYQDGVDTLNSIDPDLLDKDVELSKNIILQDYIAQGLSEDKAYKFLQKTIELGDEAVVEDARASLASLKEIQDVKLAQAKEERSAELIAEQKKQEKIDNDLKSSIYNSTEIIKDLPMSKIMKDKVYKSITNIVSKSPDGVAENKLMRDRRENPLEFDKKLYYLYELTNQFKDFSALVSKSKSKATSDFEKVLRHNKSQISNDTPGFINDPNSYGGLGDELIID